MAEAFLLNEGHTREKLMEEAMHIQKIIPERNIDEIYSSLEVFFDDPKRVQRVVLKFLDHVKEEELSKRPRKRSGNDELNQPSTSGIPPKKSSKIPVKNDADGDNRTESQPGTHTPLDTGASTHTESLPAESDKDIKKDRIDVDLEEFNFTNKSDSTSDDSSEGDKFNDIKEYLWENEGFAISSEEEEDTLDAFPEPMKNFDGRMREEVRNKPSTSFWNPVVARLTGNGNHENMPDRNMPVDLTLPGPSTANYDNLLVDPPQLDDSDVEYIDVNGVDDEKKKAHYNSLIEIFPDAQKDFVRAICDKCTQDDFWLSDTISGLLENGYPKAAGSDEQEQEQAANQKNSVKTEEEKKKVIEENYNNLLAIFPNADPTYIKETCEQIADDEDAMKKFVGDTLESGKYPTLAEYEERMKVMEIREKYLKNFKIEEFLEIFPDPFKYFFEEKKNDKNTSELSLNYLKSRYRKIRITLLQECLVKNKYSLTKSCTELDKCRSFMKSKRGEHEIQYCEKDMKNIPFMQEVAFIENKEKIEKYLNEKESKRAEAFKKAKENNELLECGCCFDDEVLAEDTVTCTEGHIFCKSCLQKYAETQIGDGKTVFSCLSNCDAEFSLKMLQGVLKPSVFSKMLQRKQIEEIKSAAIPGLEVCPFCDFASIPPEEDKIFRCLNPDCMKESCRKCKEPNHIPLRCEEVEKPEEVKIRTYIEDRMTQALVRTCWRCEKKFIKIDGCNKMRCTCGALMCYICRQPVKDYTHFNGEGGSDYHKCPLFSKNDDLHVKAVEEEATKARNEALAKNPNIQLKHDPTHILPERTQPEVRNDPNIRFMQYNGRLIPRLHLDLRIPGPAPHPRLLPIQELNFMNPVLALGQHHLMIGEAPANMVGGPRQGVGPEDPGLDDRPEVIRYDFGPAGQRQRARFGMGVQLMTAARAALRVAQGDPDEEAEVAAVPQHRHVRAAAAAQRQQERAEGDHYRRMAVARRQRVEAIAEVIAQHRQVRPADQRQQAMPAAAQEQQGMAAAAQGQQLVPAAAQGQQLVLAAAQGQQLVPAAAQGQQLVPAAAQGQQLVLAAAQGQQLVLAAAQGQQVMPAAAQGQQVMPAAAQGQQVMPAAAQGQQVMQVAAQGQQAMPAAAQGQQAMPAVGQRQRVRLLVRRTVEAQRRNPAAHLPQFAMYTVEREMLPFAEGQPVAQQADPPVDQPPLAADDFIAQWLARIPPQLEMPVAQNRQRPQEPLPQ